MRHFISVLPHELSCTLHQAADSPLVYRNRPANGLEAYGPDKPFCCGEKIMRYKGEGTRCIPKIFDFPSTISKVPLCYRISDNRWPCLSTPDM